MVEGGQHDIRAVVACDVLAKTGHSKIINLTCSIKGNHSYTVYDGVNACGTALMNITLVADAPLIINGLNKVCKTGLFVEVTGGCAGSLIVTFD